MGRIARRFDRYVLSIEVGRKHSVGNEVIEHSIEERCILGVEAQFWCTAAGKRRL